MAAIEYSIFYDTPGPVLLPVQLTRVSLRGKHMPNFSILDRAMIADIAPLALTCAFDKELLRAANEIARKEIRERSPVGGPRISSTNDVLILASNFALVGSTARLRIDAARRPKPPLDLTALTILVPAGISAHEALETRACIMDLVRTRFWIPADHLARAISLAT